MVGNVLTLLALVNSLRDHDDFECYENVMRCVDVIGISRSRNVRTLWPSYVLCSWITVGFRCFPYWMVLVADGMEFGSDG